MNLEDKAILSHQWEHEAESLKNLHKGIYSNINQSSAGDAGQQTVSMLCQLHPKVLSSFEGPKNYILPVPAGKNWHNL